MHEQAHRLHGMGMFAGALWIGVSAGGCGLHDRAAREVAVAIDQWQRRYAGAAVSEPAGGGLSSTQPVASGGAASSGAAPAEAPTGGGRDETLSLLIREALGRNPSVQAAVASLEAKLARVPQAVSLPDPMLGALVRPQPIETAAGDAYFMLSVSQMIPFPGRLDRAGRVAVAEVRVAIEQLNATRLRVIADVEKAYYQAYLMDRYVELTAANRRLLEDLSRVVGAQYEVGRVPQQDVLATEIEVARLRDDENRYRLRRDSAQAAVNQLLDRHVTTPLPATEAFEVAQAAMDVDELLRLAAAHNPELAALREQVERERQASELAKLGYWPDLTLGFEWTYVDPRGAFKPPIDLETGMRPPFNRMSEEGTDDWGISAQINVPVWFERIEAAKREARRQLLAAQHERRAAENLVAFRVFDAWSRVQTQQRTVELLTSALIPQARQAYEVAMVGYQSGEADYLSVIDNWRRTLDLEQMLHRETVDLRTALAELQREVGMQLIGPFDSEEVQP